MQISAHLWMPKEDHSEVFVQLKYRQNPQGVPPFIRGIELERFSDAGAYATVVDPPLSTGDCVWLARMDLVTADEPDIGLVLLGEGLYRFFANFQAPHPQEKFQVIENVQHVYVWWRTRQRNESWSNFSVIHPTLDEWVQELALEHDHQVGAVDPGVVALDDGQAFEALRAPSEALVDDRANPANLERMPQGYDRNDRDYDERVTVNRVRPNRDDRVNVRPSGPREPRSGS